jgi:chemotaxis protein methyltransferase CheR
MESNQLNLIYQAKLSNTEFDMLSAYIFNNFGIKMPKEKKVMLQSRLQKRLKALNMKSYAEYIEYVFSKKGQMEELINMIDEVSTNKTDFFREPAHFQYLTEYVLPGIMDSPLKYKKLKIWSAGCSSGEEVYTLGIVLNEARKTYPNLDYNICGTDISNKMLQHAQQGIYKEDRVQNIPMAMKKSYFLKSKDPSNKLVRVVPALRSKARFARLNFMDPSYNVNETFDIIFCRNVLIYFDRAAQEKVINKLCRHLDVGGYFFLGHSESITNIDVPLKQIKPTFFIKK